MTFRLFGTMLVSILAIALGPYSIAQANVAVEKPMPERIAGSDEVLIGKVVSIGIRTDVHPAFRIAKVKVTGILSKESILQPGEIIDFLYRTGEDESDAPWCCSEGHTYMLLLSRLPSGNFRSFNGPHGVFELCSAQCIPEDMKMQIPIELRRPEGIESKESRSKKEQGSESNF